MSTDGHRWCDLHDNFEGGAPCTCPVRTDVLKAVMGTNDPTGETTADPEADR